MSFITEQKFSRSYSRVVLATQQFCLDKKEIYSMETRSAKL